MKRDTYIVFGEWEDDLEDLNDEEIAALTRAFFKYVRSGEKPTFKDRMVRSCWRKIQQAEDRANAAYDEKCERNRLNGQKGGAPVGNRNATKQPKTTENNRTVEKTTETTLPNPNRDPNPNPNRGRGGDSDSERDREAAAPQDTTTTTDLKDRIIQEWNRHDFVQKIKTLNTPSSRWLNTLTAVRTAGGEEEFLKLIRSLGDHAYFRDQNKKGYRVVYDWFINLDNFQGVIEGRYKDSRSKYGDDWEVVDLG